MSWLSLQFLVRLIPLQVATSAEYELSLHAATTFSGIQHRASGSVATTLIRWLIGQHNKADVDSGGNDRSGRKRPKYPLAHAS